MQKPSFLLFLGLAFSLASCQPQPELSSTSTALLQTPTLPAASPTPGPTFTLAPEGDLTPTNAPQQTLSTAPACFAIQGVPFAFMPDNFHMLYKGDGGIQTIDLRTTKSEEFIPGPTKTGLLSAIAALSPTGDRLALALSDNSIQVYQTADKKLLHTLSGHTDIITELEFSPDGEKLYSASHDTWVRVWDRDGKEIDAFQPSGADNFPSEVLGMGLSADGKLLATMPLDGKVKLWDAKKLTLVRELGAYGSYDNSDAVFSPDGKELAAITANGLFLWRISDGEQLLGGNPGINAMALAFSPDGRFLVYWDVQGNYEITFLSPDGSEKVGMIPSGVMPVWLLLFSPDGTLMAAASDAETHVWRVQDGKLLYVGKPFCP